MYSYSMPLKNVSGREVEWGRAPCGRPSSNGDSLYLNRIAPCGRLSTFLAILLARRYPAFPFSGGYYVKLSA